MEAFGAKDLTIGGATFDTKGFEQKWEVSVLLYPSLEFAEAGTGHTKQLCRRTGDSDEWANNYLIDSRGGATYIHFRGGATFTVVVQQRV